MFGMSFGKFQRANGKRTKASGLTRRMVLAVVVVTVMTMTIPLQTAQAFDPVAAGALVYEGYQGVNKILNAAGVSKQKLGWAFRGMHHTWWGCVYKDGTTVFNNFRSYRNERDVLEYYTGQNSGDCDAIVQRGNSWQHVCYGPSGAREMVRRHGPIVRVYAHGPAD